MIVVAKLTFRHGLDRPLEAEDDGIKNNTRRQGLPTLKITQRL